MSRPQTTLRPVTRCRADNQAHDKHGTTPRDDALKLVRCARARSRLAEDQDLLVALQHVAATRGNS